MLSTPCSLSGRPLPLAFALAALPRAASPGGFAGADDYPTRPITLIVPFPPGGSTTVMARNVADKMSAALGQQIVVDNRGGAGGTLGTRFVAKAAPDGYTILLSYTATMAIAPAMNANAGYDPAQGFCADRHDRVRAECPCGASVAAGAFDG